jgi:hypothetical protein
MAADPAQRRLYIVMDGDGEPVKAFWNEPRALAFIAGCATPATYAVLSVLLAAEEAQDDA